VTVPALRRTVEETLHRVRDMADRLPGKRRQPSCAKADDITPLFLVGERRTTLFQSIGMKVRGAFVPGSLIRMQ
jgi:hypothetical protein